MRDERPTSVRYFVLAALCAAAAIAYIQRPLMGVAATAVRAERGFTTDQMGQLMSSWLWTYAIFQIPAGRLADAWGGRRSLSLFCAVWSVATILAGFTPTFWPLYLLGSLFGAAQAGIFPCAAIVVRQWFPPEKRGLATAFIAAFQQVGAAVAAILGGYWIAVYLGLWQPAWTEREHVPIPQLPAFVQSLSEASGDVLAYVFHWSGMFVAFSLPGLIWAAWFSRWYRPPHENPAMNDAERELLPAEPRPVERSTSANNSSATKPASEGVWVAMLTSRSMWLICSQQFCRAFSYIFYVTWFPTYLKHSRGLTVEKSGMVTALMFVAALLGALLGGALSDAILARTKSRRIAKQGMAFVSLLGAGGMLAAAYAVPTVNAAVAVLFSGSFLAALAGPIGYSVTIDISGRQTATVFGAMNMSGNVGAALFPIIATRLVAAADASPIREWIEPHGIRGWDLVLFACAASYLVSGLCWLLINPDGTIFRSTPAPTAATTGPA